MLKTALVDVEVSYAMATGLRVLRLFGVAPLRISYIRDGIYRIRFSCIIFILSTTLILLINVLIIVFYLYTIWFDESKNPDVSKFVKVCRHTALVIPIITSTSVSIYNANRRMDHLLYILKQILKIRRKIRYDCKLDPTSRDVIVTSCGLIFLNIVLFIFDLILEDSSSNILFGTNDYNPIMYFKIVTHIGHCFTLALQLQYLFLATVLRFTTKALNCKLSQLNFYEDYLRITPRYNDLRSLSGSYLLLREVMVKVTQEDGLFLTLLLCACLTRIFVTTYNLWFVYKKIIPLNYFMLKLTLQIYVLITYCVHLLLLIEPFHHLNKEMENSKAVISALLGTLPRSGLYSELDIFDELFLKQQNITPLGLFKFDRTLIVTIVGYVVTFLLISNQLQY